MRGHNTYSGLALLIVVGVLGILAVLAAAFVTMAQLERRASRQRLAATKAMLLARSGIEDALARLAAGQVSFYGGEDWDLSGTLNGVEVASEVFKPGTLDVETCPADQAMRPSFFAKDSLGQPLLAEVEGRQRGYSGRLDAAQGGNLYALKVEDESAKINVNGGILDVQNRDLDAILDHADPDPGVGWNLQLERILRRLGQQPNVNVTDLGNTVIANRPPGGYRTLEEIQALPGIAKDLSPWLTVSSWSDPAVVRPNGFDAQPFPLAMNEVMKARGPLRLEEGGRPPVNLNAAPKPVLVALLDDLKGTTWHYEEDLSSMDPGNSQRTFELKPAKAASVAAALVDRRRVDPFDTWGEFEAFVDTLVPSVINGWSGYAYLWSGGGNLCVADLVKANFNPNTQLMKTVPDQLVWKWIDKSDLIVWSTEGSLHPTGSFRVSCTGRVLGAGGRLVAEITQEAAVEAFGLLRQTSQADFVGGRKLEDYLSLSTDPLLRTTGASAAWNTWSGAGLAALTYPCPPTALPGTAADFDGGVGLATVDLFSSNPEGGILRFLHHFDDGWDADLGASTDLRASALPADDFLQADPSKSVWPDSPDEPSTLRSDGMHAQWQRSPCFQALGNLPLSDTSDRSDYATLSYWVKHRDIRGISSNKPQLYHVAVERIAAWKTGVPELTQAVVSAFAGYEWGILAENAAVAADDDHERIFEVNMNEGSSSLMGGPRWALATGHFDTDALTHGEDVHLWVKGIRGSGASDKDFKYPQDWDPATNEILTADSGTDIVVGPAFRSWYGIQSMPVPSPQFAHHVLDELAILDFTDTAGTAVANAQIWHDTRYVDGRYYKQDDARFLSTLLAPEPGRLLRAWWTEYLPKENRQELLFSGSTMPASGQPRLRDASLEKARIDIELLDTSGTLNSPALRSLRQGGAIQETLSGFRYRAWIRPGLADPMTQPVLETPFLDDITFAWQRATGPRVTAWR
jgi:hypothetical protein